MKNKIIIPTDLTKVASQAIKQAAAIAVKTNASLTLLHVLSDKSPSEDDIKKYCPPKQKTFIHTVGYIVIS